MPLFHVLIQITKEKATLNKNTTIAQTYISSHIRIITSSILAYHSTCILRCAAVCLEQLKALLANQLELHCVDLFAFLGQKRQMTSLCRLLSPRPRGYHVQCGQEEVKQTVEGNRARVDLSFKGNSCII